MSRHSHWRALFSVSRATVPSFGMRHVHDRLVRLGSEPVPAPDAAWQSLRRRLPDRPLALSDRVTLWVRRPLVAIIATGLLSTGVAYAAGVQPIRSGVDSVIAGVTSIVGSAGEARDDREPRDGGAFDEPASSEESQGGTSSVDGSGIEREGASDDPADTGGADGTRADRGSGGSGSHGDEDEGDDDPDDVDDADDIDDHEQDDLEDDGLDEGEEQDEPEADDDDEKDPEDD